MSTESLLGCCVLSLQTESLSSQTPQQYYIIWFDRFWRHAWPSRAIRPRRVQGRKGKGGETGANSFANVGRASASISIAHTVLYGLWTSGTAYVSGPFGGFRCGVLPSDEEADAVDCSGLRR